MFARLVASCTRLAAAVGVIAASAVPGHTQTITLIKDIDPTPYQSSIPRSLVDLGGVVYFNADDGTNGRELWRSDGTAAGTRMVRDIVPGPIGSHPIHLTVAGDRIFFTTQALDLWVTDGSASGTRRVRSFGTLGAPLRPIASGRDVYFVVDGGPNARNALWFSDGTANGTVMIRDFPVRPTSKSVHSLVPFGDGRLFFVADDGVVGLEPWVTDGTPQGTQRIADVNPSGSSHPSSAVAWRGRIYFTATTAAGIEPWVTDGTANGTILVRNLGRQQDSVIITATATALYFSAPSTTGRAIWMSDGTGAGTTLFRSGLSTVAVYPFGRRAALVLDNDVWTSDGTVANTRREFSFPGTLRSFLASGDRFAWCAIEHNEPFPRPWLMDFTRGTATSLGAFFLQGFNAMSAGRYVFSGGVDPHGLELSMIDPGASTTPVGPSCATTPWEPALRMNDPVLGTAVRLTVDGARSGAVVHPYFNFGIQRPQRFLSTCFLHVPLVGVAALPAFGAANGSTIPIPNVGALQGLTGTIQAAVTPGRSPRGFDLTNALHIRFGL